MNDAPADTSSGSGSPPGGLDGFVLRLRRGDWLRFLPASSRGPVARLVMMTAATAVALVGVAPFADDRGGAYLDASFARTLTALAATRGLDAAISLAQSSEISFTLGPGGSLGIGQVLDPVNDLVEQYATLLLTSTTALGAQQLALRAGRSFGWWLFVPALAAMALAVFCGPGLRGTLSGWGRRLFAIALFARLALPLACWIDSQLASQFLEADYQRAAAIVTATTADVERLNDGEQDGDDRPWYERYNPVEAVKARAGRLRQALAQVGESIVNLVIYFTVSTIVLPLGTLWVLSRLSSLLWSPRIDP